MHKEVDWHAEGTDSSDEQNNDQEFEELFNQMCSQFPSIDRKEIK